MMFCASLSVSAPAHTFLMQRVLDGVLALRADEVWRERALQGQRRRGRAPHLGPEVLQIARVTAQLQGDEVILLVTRQRLSLNFDAASCCCFKVFG